MEAMVQALLAARGWLFPAGMCVWMALHSLSGFGVGHSAPSLCAPVQGQHLVSCQGEPLLGVSTNMSWWSAHADSCPLSAIPEQDPAGSAAAPF